MNETLLNKIDAAFYLYLFVGVVQDGEDGPAIVYQRGEDHEAFQRVRDFAIRSQSSPIRDFAAIQSVRLAPTQDHAPHVIVVFERKTSPRPGQGETVIFCGYESNDHAARKSSRRTMNRILTHIHADRTELADDS